jgi:hypothetical protein
LHHGPYNYFILIFIIYFTFLFILKSNNPSDVLRYNELTDRFKTVLASGRQAALVPEGGGVMGNLVAAVASKLIIPAKGPVAGDTPEAIFAKAEYYLDHGALSEAVDQLSKLRGMPASIARYAWFPPPPYSFWLCSIHFSRISKCSNFYRKILKIHIKKSCAYLFGLKLVALHKRARKIY